MDALPIFVGHDGREAEGTLVCEHSLRVNSGRTLHIQRLCEPALRHIGLYTREWTAEGQQKFDLADGKPYSTLFSFSRFLTPALMQHDGVALFCDSDIVFTGDVADLFALSDPRYAVQVVQHEPLTDMALKMDGQRQEPYPRKGWSSLMLFNCRHPSNQRLTPAVVNSARGQWLHGLSWLDDSEIGALPPTWNWLVGESPPLPDDALPAAIHFTRGIPSMPGHEDDQYAGLWRQAYAEAIDAQRLSA